jgi:SAM-dependent methyltransferase
LRDIEFWVRQAQQVGGSVLELACGTGRIAIPMAETGLPVVGIDVSDVYLSRARQKSAERGLNVMFERADVRRFDLHRLFRFVAFPFRSVAVLEADADLHACFACVREHIEEGGLFVVDAFNPSRGTISGTLPTLRYPHPDGAGMVEVDLERRFDSTARIETSVFTFQQSRPSAPIRAELRLRLYTAAELSAALRANGFDVALHLGGYDESPYSESAPLQLLVAKAV